MKQNNKEQLRNKYKDKEKKEDTNEKRQSKK